MSVELIERPTLNLESLLTPQALVYGAGACYVLGLVIVNQLVLRALILLGTLFYIAYYWTATDTPLWEAIYISALILLANIIGIFVLVARKSRLAIPAEHADIRPLFEVLPPGDFRALMKLAKRYTVDQPTQITTENMPGTKLFYVVKGTIWAEKGGHQFALPYGIFVGEVAYIIGQNSSATTQIEAGTEVLEWSFDALRRKSARNARFKLALDAAITHDLARKVALAVAPDRPQWPALDEMQRAAGAV